MTAYVGGHTLIKGFDMKANPGRKKRLFLIANKIVSVITLFFFSTAYVFALPAGQQVVNGQVSMTTQGNNLTITNSPNAIINWQSFSISNNEAVRFIQQYGSSAVLNRVIGQDPSKILGLLQSNGRVFLINPNGILFGQGARIDVNGLVASTLNLSNQDFLAGKYNFTAGANAGAIENQGTITTPTGGKVYLIAPNIENSGIINSPKGDIILAAGHSVYLVDSLDPDISVVISAPENKAVNLGQIVAESGRVGIYGGLISQKGIVRADSAVVGENGKIVFKATKGITLDKDSITSANGVNGGEISIQSEEGDTLVSGTVTATGSEDKGGSIKILGNRVGIIENAFLDASGKNGGGTVLVGGDYQGNNPDIQNAIATYMGKDALIKADALETGDGGKVIVWADDVTRFYGSIYARGGSLSGNGGFVETSGKKLLDAWGIVNLSAPFGKGGMWLLDPYNMTISTNPSSAYFMSGNGPTEQIWYADDHTYESVLNYASVNEALTNGMTLTVETYEPVTYATAGRGNVTVDAPVTASLAGGESSTLNLHAQANINFTANGSISNGAGVLNVNLGAGMKNPCVSPEILTDPGSVASSITMANGSFIVTGGGSVTATAKTNGITLAGINTGSGSLTVNSGGGAISQNSALTVGGTTSLTAGAAAITLTDLGNNFGGAVSASNTGYAIQLTDTNAIQLGTISTSDNITLTAGGTISQSAAISGALLTTSSVGGTTLNSANTVTSFNATNTTSGNIALTNTAAPLTITGISQSGGGNVTVSNTGSITMGAGSSIVTNGGNVTMSGASITATSIDTGVSTESTNSGNINLTATSGSISATDLKTKTKFLVEANQWAGNTGAITLDASTDVTVTGELSTKIYTAGSQYTHKETGDSGAISITAHSGAINTVDIITQNTTCQSDVTSGKGGAVTLNAATSVVTGDIKTFTANNDGISIIGKGGNVSITAGTGITTGSIDTSNVTATWGYANNQIAGGGDVALTANGGNISTSYITTRSSIVNETGTGTVGPAGSVTANATTGSITVGNIDASASAPASSGTVTVGAGGNVSLSALGGTLTPGTINTSSSRTGTGSTSNGGSVTLFSHNDYSTGGIIDATSTGAAGGNITLSADGNININSTINSAQLALYYGQGSAGGGTATYSVNAPVNLPTGLNFSTKLGSNGTTVAYTVIGTMTTLQGMNLGGNYALGSNINESTTAWDGGKGFIPLSTFTGKFDGLGHTITGLYINRTTDYVGLFGDTSNSAKIRNVGLVGVNITGKHNTGGLVGLNAGEISNSYTTGSVTGTGTSTSDGYGDVGGLVGDHTGSISNSYSIAAVTGTNTEDVGGLVGENNGTITNSYHSVGLVSGKTNVGGLVGGNYTGGIISNTYNTGAVTVTGSYGGGLVGRTSGGSISNTYSTGAVSGAGTYKGGLLGWYGGGTISNSYWDKETSGISTAGYGTGKTTAEMMTAATFTSWDIAKTGSAGKVWRIYEGHTAPLLTSFLTPLTLTGASDVTTTYTGAPQSGGTTSLYVDGTLLKGAAATEINAGFYNGYYSTQQGYDIIGGNLTINAASLSAISLSGTRAYDGTVYVDYSIFTLSGLVGSQTLSLGGVGTVADKNVGNNKIVTLGSLFLGDGSNGGLASNYTFSGGTQTANITQAPLTVTATTNTKGYDRTTSAAATPTITGLVGDDTATLSEVYDSKIAGTGKTLTPAAVISDGNSGNNYSVTYVNNTTGVIQPGQTVSGMLNVASAGKTIDFAVNGTLLPDQASTDTSGNYSVMVPLNTIPNNSALLAYVNNDTSVKSASVYLSTGGDIANLLLSSNTVTASSSGAISNTTLGTAKGSLTSTDIPYTFSGNNLTLSSGFNLTMNAGSDITLNGLISTDTGIVTLKSGGAIINGMSSARSINARSLFAEAVNGIGSGDPLMTGVSNLNAINTSLNNIQIDNTGVLAVSRLSNGGSGNVILQNIGAITTNGESTTDFQSGGNFSITAHSPLTIGSGGVKAYNDISLEATDSDNLTINGPIASSNGNIALKAGNSIVLGTGGTLSAPNGTVTMTDKTVPVNDVSSNNTLVALQTTEGTTIATVESKDDSDKKDEDKKKKKEGGEKPADDKKKETKTKNYCN